MRREIFAKNLRQLIKDSGIRQTELAFALGISSAAVSQFVHGTAMPNSQQLIKILTVLRTPPHIAEKFKYQLLLARSEPKRNKPETSKNSDKLDESYQWPFTMDQFTIDEYLDLCNKNDDGICDFLGVSEENVVGIPMIYLEDLQNYDNNKPLAHFAQDYMRDMIVRDFAPFEPAVIVQTSGSKLNMAVFNKIQLVITQKISRDMTSLELCFSKSGQFWLLPQGHKMSKWHVFCDKTPEKKEDMLWRLPVLEVTMAPITKNK